MIHLLAFTLSATAIPLAWQGPPPVTVLRGFQFEIPLEVDNLTGVGSWGSVDRVADHAVVAMNGEKDILVAYDTNRPDLDQAAGQIEIAMFRRSGMRLDPVGSGQPDFQGVHEPNPAADQVDAKALKRWLAEARDIQWDDKNIVKRKGKLERLK